MRTLTSTRVALLLAACLAFSLFIPGVVTAQGGVPLEFDSDRRNPQLESGIPADEILDPPSRDAAAAPSVQFGTAIGSFAGEGCPLSIFPEDPDDSSFAIGVTPYEAVAPRLCAAAESSRITVAAGGTTVEGREVPVVEVTRSWTPEERDANAALRDLLVEDPQAAEQMMADGGYEDYRPTIMAIGNIHGNEYEGLDGILNWIEYLAGADTNAPIVENTAGLSEEEIADLPTVSQVLNNFVVTFMPTVNPDGRVNGQRRNVNGFDLNRDHITGSQPETRIMRDVITAQQPLLFIDLHGYVGPGGLIEPTTPPHNFAYEYDLYIQGALPNGLSMEAEAYRRSIIRDGTGETGTYLPYRDDEQGWDDWPPIFTAMYAIFQGGSGHTVEIPLQPDSDELTPLERAGRVEVNAEFAQAAIDGSVLEAVRSRDELMTRQLQWHLRGVAGEQQSNDVLVGAFEGYDDADVWETQYPDAYVIPIGDGQESEAAAAVLVDALLAQRVSVTELTAPSTIGGTEYPTGSWVVNMRQAKRAIAQTMLDIGQDITPRGIEFMYDISGWSHTDLWGATVDRVDVGENGLAPIGRAVTTTPGFGEVRPGPADAYTFDLRDEASIRGLNRILAAEVTVHRAPDGRILVAPSARPLLQEIAVAEDIVFTPVVGLPDGRRQIFPITVGTTRSGSDLYVVRDVLGFPTVELDAGALNDGDALDDISVLWTDEIPEGTTTAATDNIDDFLDDGGGAVASNSGIALLEASNVEVPVRNRVAGLSNGTVTVEQRAGSQVMPARPAQDVSFLFSPTFFGELPEGWQVEQTVLPGTAGGVMRAGHWAQGAEAIFDQDDYIGQAITVSSELDNGGRVVVTGADVSFRDHTKGLFKDLADWFVWSTIGDETTADLGGPLAGQVTRVQGDNRIQTAVELSEATFAAGAPAAVIASAGTFPDALSAGPYAATLGAPVLLTDAGAAPEELLAEIERLAPAQLIVIGGTAAVSEAVESELSALAPVRRIAGPDRYTTSALVSAEYAQSEARVVIATGESFPDALAGGVLAGRGQGPVLLTQPGALPQSTADELARLEPTEVLVMGGTAAVSDETVTAIDGVSGVAARRIAGADRFETAVAAANEIGPVGTVYIATGNAFADALAAVPVALRGDGLILLVQPDAVPPSVTTTLDVLDPFHTIILGGTAAVSAEVEAALTG